MKIYTVFKTNLNLFLWLLAFCINIITFLVIFYQIHPFQKTLILKYNVLAGVEWQGKGWNIFLIPLAAFCISFVNLILYRVLKENKHFFSPLIIFFTLIIQIIFFISVLFLSTIN